MVVYVYDCRYRFFRAFLNPLIVFMDLFSLLRAFHIHAPLTFNEEEPRGPLCCGIIKVVFLFLVPILCILEKGVK